MNRNGKKKTIKESSGVGVPGERRENINIFVRLASSRSVSMPVSLWTRPKTKDPAAEKKRKTNAKMPVPL